jgi:hypothetical protein
MQLEEDFKETKKSQQVSLVAMESGEKKVH